MTDTTTNSTAPSSHEEPRPLPLLVDVTEAFAGRLPSQRMVDALLKIDPTAVNFMEIAQEQPFRLTAFRALVRDFPERDFASLWLHSYDVEVQVEKANPTSETSATPSPHSSASGA
jgi:hypothetical protein